jgi:3D-(3,5/4)-trihydroxycyclohexane-1,2-dione acylhydrolase (decyclizing)
VGRRGPLVRCLQEPFRPVGSTSANTLAAEADVVLAVGTGLQDFTTASWTVFDAGVRIVTVNAARFNAVKHAAHAVVGDARETLTELTGLMGYWSVGGPWAAHALAVRSDWDSHVDELRRGPPRTEHSLALRRSAWSTMRALPTTTC